MLSKNPKYTLLLLILLGACSVVEEPKNPDSVKLTQNTFSNSQPVQGKKAPQEAPGEKSTTRFFSEKSIVEGIDLLSRDPQNAQTILLKEAKLSSGKTKMRLEFLGALAANRAGNHNEAALLFEKLQSEYTLLSGYAAAFSAESYLLQNNEKKAIEMASLVPEDEPLFGLSRKIRAQALDLLNDPETKTAYLGYLKESPRSPIGDQIYFRLAELYLKEGNKKSAADAYRAIVARWPFGELAKEAQSQLKTLSVAKKSLILTPDEFLQQGMVFYRAQQHKNAESALAAAAKSSKKAVRCRARFYQGKSVYRQRSYRRAGQVFTLAASACKGVDQTLRKEALYNIGKSYQRGSKCKEAIVGYLAVEKEFSKETIADDARLHRGECLLAQKKASAEKLLLSVPIEYPGGDMGEEAIWVLAWNAYQKNDLDRTEKFLQEGLRSVEKVTNFWAEGRLGYWYGRVKQKQKDPESAKKAYVKVIEEYPLSYYARLASLRLEEIDPKAIPTFSQPKSISPSALPDIFSLPVTQTPSFLRGLELLRLGLFAYAKDEFSSLPSDDEETLWLLADLYDKVGAYPVSHNIPRRRVPEFRFETPEESISARRWHIAYPNPFASLIKKWSEKHQIPQALSFAIMREESSFSPGIESFAHAIGLMQLILPTARSMAKELGIQVSREDLRDPETNISLGTRYLRFLFDYFDGHVALSVAAYNAGQGAVRRWQKSFGSLPLDEFVENIPYKETRGYTKRVLSTYEIYSHLYELSQEKVSLQLPSWR